MSVKAAKSASMAVALGLVLAGCGVRGSLEYPNDPASGPATTTATADSAQGKPEGAAQKPHKASILDALIR